MTLLRPVIAALFLACGLALAPVATYAEPGNTVQATESVHPAIEQANTHRAKEARRKRYLLFFPIAAVGVTVALIVITRRK
ncbi:MAG: hypothetical protein AOY29_01420 [Alcanivorax borkumensis]|jgi:hypothetical protein|uniref:Uncharacterized protein n=1 Tax=Alcanivorax borkumensis (strain ATCC 700651 / DSM 11573 / NCIMB 13689 / SK2) TaxID=393595 RepID=Q0VMF6_ALCBS|nr:MULTISPECIES: hypothetical protein [Alcanivorax]OJH07237.1 MAG: hypothetical protein AOY29_01420 [Alcanivorax borkumensis]BAP15099.1 hypothetical protein AS19_22480 [Alcanivorax sp. NBRC 101098]CAL17642.1 hypothetical protein ABO_2194 [Alcanivorax borkumensis SK2]